MVDSSSPTTRRGLKSTRDCTQSVDLINNSCIFIIMLPGKVLGIESHVLSAEETKELYPLMNVSDVYGTLYSPLDGTIDPHGLCTALSRFSTRSGAKVIENCCVDDVLTSAGTFGSKVIEGVVTNMGMIKTKCVVNCTGAWANDINSLVGVSVPLVAMKHAYVVTEKIPGHY